MTVTWSIEPLSGWRHFGEELLGYRLAPIMTSHRCIWATGRHTLTNCEAGMIDEPTVIRKTDANVRAASRQNPALMQGTTHPAYSTHTTAPHTCLPDPRPLSSAHAGRLPTSTPTPRPSQHVSPAPRTIPKSLHHYPMHTEAVLYILHVSS